DGCGGAGKTTFAAALSREAGSCPVVHTDDFATHDDALGWWPRMLDEVIDPLSEGRPARFRRYDWGQRCLGDEVTVQPAAVVVIEGVGASRAAWRHRLAMSMWVDAPRDVRLARGIARDGEQL